MYKSDKNDYRSYYFYEHVLCLNEKVDNAQISIGEDLEITDLSPKARAVYNSWTYHWWGCDRKFTKTQAEDYVEEIEYAILGLGAGAAVTAPAVVIAGSLALSASWYGLLAKRIEANNKGKKGVLVEIHWSRTFDITPL